MIEQYGTLPIIDQLLYKLRLRRGYIPLNMTMALAKDLKRKGMLR